MMTRVGQWRRGRAGGEESERGREEWIEVEET
jgi:hypothetical protein